MLLLPILVFMSVPKETREDCFVQLKVPRCCPSLPESQLEAPLTLS